MLQGKNWYESKAVWIGIAQTVAGLLGAIGLVLTPEQQQNWAEILAALSGLVLGPGMIWARLVAVLPIVPKARREIEALKRQLETLQMQNDEAQRQGFVPPLGRVVRPE
jgi:hypothetical protein